LLGALGRIGLLPFIEGRGRDQAAALGEGVPEAGLVCQGFRTSVDEFVADGGVLTLLFQKIDMGKFDRDFWYGPVLLEL
jgi:hypothetical protein